MTEKSQEKITIHSLKLNTRFVDPVHIGLKTFEIRKNDRKYHIGDFLNFRPVNDDGKILEQHPICESLYQITYIMHVPVRLEGYGIDVEDDTVVFSMRKVPDKDIDTILREYAKQNKI